MTRCQWKLALAASSLLIQSVPADAGTVFPAEALPVGEIMGLAQLEKDQFETTTAFNKRKCDAMAKLLGIDITKPIVFRRFEGTRTWYDADRQQYVFENLSKAGTPSSGYYLTLHSREVEKPSFLGRNAYGVSKQIKVKEGDYIALSVPHSSHVVQHLGVVLPMKPDQARAFSGDLRLEVVTRLGPPCISTDLHRDDPTLDSPVKETKRVYAIHAVLGATTWRIVRASTGEVVKSGKR